MHLSRSLFIHRRDLRLDDNTALRAARARSGAVAPIFIFDPRQIGEHNQYRSHKAIQFMCASLAELASAYRKVGGALSFFEGEAHDVLDRVLYQARFEAVFVNADYTPFARMRDESLRRVCEQHSVAFEVLHDALLVGDPSLVKNASGEPYKVFTPFFKQALMYYPVPHPTPFEKKHGAPLVTETLEGSDDTLPARIGGVGVSLSIPSGMSGAHILLANARTLSNYGATRDIMSKTTSRLSAHHKFGTISIRESWHALKDALGADHPLLRQLYWRDFFTQLAFHFPHVFGSPFNRDFDAITWSDDDISFQRWKNGTTGFPIIDAGIRELNETGYMHNRARMIVASFLTKDLHIDWRRGERYFAETLIDYDPAVNNGSWQWVAGTGADAAPYFRIFNPWLQQKKYDPDAAYIKQWVPELKDVAPDVIHNFATSGVPHGLAYPAPMIDHTAEAARAKKLYAIAPPKTP